MHSGSRSTLPILLAVAVSAGIGSGAAAAQTLRWIEDRPSISPPKLAFHNAVFDEQRGSVLLFGGTTGFGIGGVLGETWIYDGTNWSRRQAANSPPGVWAYGLSYDVARQRTVLFGGQTRSGTKINETWDWDGTAWSRVKTTTSPSARFAVTAYDRARARTVLFGGWGTSAIADTWEFDGTNWSKRQAVSQPAPRGFHGCAYDVARQRTVIFGGLSGSSKSLDDTWEWDGVSWSRIATIQKPPARAYPAMAYDPVRKRVVLFGGLDGARIYADTWEFDGKNWSQVQATAMPIARGGASLAPAPRGPGLLLYGGMIQKNNASTAETWRFGAIAPPLSADTATVSLSGQGQQKLTLQAGTSNAGRLYILLGSLSGTSPGLRLGSVLLPLQADAYFDITASFPNSPLLTSSLGTLDSSGMANASFTAIPQIPASLIGKRFDHAYLVLNTAAATPFVFASNAVELTLQR